MKKITPKRYGSTTPKIVSEKPDNSKVAIAEALIDLNTRLSRLEEK